MHAAILIWIALFVSSGRVLAADTGGQQTSPPVQGKRVRPQVEVVPRNGSVDVNRPQTPFDCELPIGENWYGSRARCLAYLCAGENVYNEYVFDADGRRRKNPCYGQSPTEFPPE